MKWRRVLWVTGLLVGLAFAAILILGNSGPAEPVYRGRPLSVWMQSDFTLGTHPAQRGRQLGQSQAALQALGTNALPWLMYEFKRTPPRWRRALKILADRHMPRSFRFTRDLERFNLAGIGLQLLGPDVVPALPQLSECLEDPYRNHVAVRAMANAGAPAVPYLLQAMCSTNPTVRAVATSGMVLASRDQDAVVAPLVEGMRSTNREVRKAAGMQFIDLPFHPELTIPAFSGALSDPDLEIRRHATNMMRLARESPQRFETGLRNLLQSTNASTALAASNALFILKQPDP